MSNQTFLLNKRVPVTKEEYIEKLKKDIEWREERILNERHRYINKQNRTKNKLVELRNELKELL